jgi:dolichyl-phosphate beta-glucosyltransferase
VPQSIALSVVLPAYNEALRLPPYLAAVRTYLDGRYGDRYESIVVDDGSEDGLCGILERFARDWPQLRSIRHPRNQGKGAAVRTGVLAARGQLVLFADADGATPIDQESRLAAAIHAGADLAVGSRLLAAAGARRSRNWLRGLSGRAFAAVARWLLRLPVRDPQCGFKMFRGEVGRRLFSMVRESRYLFDLEVLVLARRLGYRTAEVPVNWTEVPGGHFSPARQLFKILVDLRRLHRRLRTTSPVATTRSDLIRKEKPE